MNNVKRKIGNIAKFIRKLPKRIVELLFSPFKNMQRHFTIKNGPWIVLGSTFLITMLTTISGSLAYLVDMPGNLIIMGLINFVSIFIIGFLSLVLKVNYKCKFSNISQIFSKIPLKTILQITFVVASGTILTSYQIFSTFLGPINEFLEPFGQEVQKIAEFKEYIVMGCVYLITSIMSPIPECIK